MEETWLRGRSLDAADQRNQAEILAAMQQWAMNRGRIEEEIMRRQESRRYVARSGRFYAEAGSYQRVQSEAAELSSRAHYSATGATRSKKAANASDRTNGENRARSVARPRTASSAPRAKPIVTTPVVVLKKASRAKGSSPAQNKKKPPMHFKYGPRSTGANEQSSNYKSAAAAEIAAGAARKDHDAPSHQASSKPTSNARPPRARPARRS